MFDRSRAYDFRSSYLSIYNTMIESGTPEDKANAEAYRLASEAWLEIAQFNQRPDIIDEQGVEIEFDVEAPIANMKLLWEEYCRTGIPVNNVADLVNDLQKEIKSRSNPDSDLDDSSPKTDEKNLQYIQENAIDILIARIHDELGTARQEAELTTVNPAFWPVYDQI
jgi:hypothetical protein